MLDRFLVVTNPFYAFFPRQHFRIAAPAATGGAFRHLRVQFTDSGLDLLLSFGISI